MEDGSELGEDSAADNEVTDSDTAWQLVRPTTKRKPTTPSKIPAPKRQHLNMNASTSKNAFAALANNDDDDDDSNNNEVNDTSEPKPPPIVIPNVTDIRTMVNKFSKILNPNEFTYKSVKDGNVRVMVKSVKSFRELVNYLDSNGINYHTYQLKQEKAFRAVIKKLHYSTPTVLVKDEIEKLGHKVRNIMNIKSRISKEPLPMFYLDLEPQANNKDIYKVKYLYNCVVNVEPPLKTDDIVQCHRCQQFGHTKTYCRNHFKCVKCGLDHASAVCTKNVNTQPQCTNCLKNHTANYRGCEKYQELLHRKQLVRKQHSMNNPQSEFYIGATNFPHINNHNNPSNNINNTTNSTQFSYSNALKNDGNQQQNQSFKKIEELLTKQIELTNNLLNMMSVLIAKLCN